MENYITYEEAASMYGVSVLTICKTVQDNPVKLKSRFGRIYLNAEHLRLCKIKPLKDVIRDNLLKYSSYYLWREAHPQASLGEANQRFINMYGVREEKLEK